MPRKSIYRTHNTYSHDIFNKGKFQIILLSNIVGQSYDNHQFDKYKHQVIDINYYNNHFQSKTQMLKLHKRKFHQLDRGNNGPQVSIYKLVIADSKSKTRIAQQKIDVQIHTAPLESEKVTQKFDCKSEQKWRKEEDFQDLRTDICIEKGEKKDLELENIGILLASFESIGL